MASQAYKTSGKKESFDEQFIITHLRKPIIPEKNRIEIEK
jgi:hypothetical protein